MEHPVDLAVGTVFAGDFRVERFLGRGGMGAVYVAHQISTGRDRALKVMHPSLVREEKHRMRFEQEARVGSRIKSEHVVEVIAAGVDTATGIPFLVMELLEGEDLETRVQRTGKLAVGEVATILADLCHALAAAHEVGVVHRDLKPENVFLAHSHRQGTAVTVKLLDLGIAKLVAEALPADTAAVGTPLWMAPEQTGGKVGPATDVWALGLLTFWMLTGRSYWRAANADSGENVLMSTLREVVVEPIESASQRAARFGCESALPAGFDAWFARTVARDPSQRFPNAKVAKAELDRALIGSAETAQLDVPLRSLDGENPTGSRSVIARTQSADSLPTARGRRRPMLYGLAALTVALGVMGIAVTRWNGSNRPAPSATLAPLASAPPVASVDVDADAGVDPEDDKTVWRIPIGDSPERGPRDADVTIVEFGNFQCPFSKGIEAKLRGLIDEMPGRVRLVWKDDPLAIHSQAEAASQLAREARSTAGDEGFWKAHDFLIDPDFKPSPESLRDAAKELGIEKAASNRAMTERTHLADITRDADLADDFGVTGTPGFFVNGRRVMASPDLATLRRVVKEELDHAGQLRTDGIPKGAIYDRIVSAGRGGLPLEIRKLRGMRTHSPARGSSHPSVVLIEVCGFTDLVCRLVDPTVDRLLAEHKDELGTVWLDFPDPQKDAAQAAAIVSRALSKEAGVEGFDRIRRLLLQAQLEPGGLTRKAVEADGRAAGLSRTDVTHALEDPELLGEIAYDTRVAKSAGIQSAPAFLICGTDFCTNGGYFLTGGHPLRAFEKRIRLVLEAKGKPLPRSAL